jgi:hypothetical protein
MMAAKLARAKEIALEVDPEYYRSLWVNSHEACPDWLPPPDEAAADAYLGNGYFPSWCAHVIHSQLQRAALDPRFAYGETILTVWPPPDNFTGLNAVTRVIHVADRVEGRTVTVPMPIFHVLGLLSDMGDAYWVLPAQTVGGHTVGGFASRDDRGTLRVLLFAHHAQDTQSRSEAEFDLVLHLDGMEGSGPVNVRDYRFDAGHNSPFRRARALRARAAGGGPADPERLKGLTLALEGDDPQAQHEALRVISNLDASSRQALASAVFRLAGQAKDRDVRTEAQSVLRRAFGPTAFPPADVEAIRHLTEYRATVTTSINRDAGGRLRLTSRLAANGCNFLIVDEVKKP